MKKYLILAALTFALAAPVAAHAQEGMGAPAAAPAVAHDHDMHGKKHHEWKKHERHEMKKHEERKEHRKWKKHEHKKHERHEDKK